MRSVLLVALSNLRRKPGQALLVGAVLFLSVLLFFTGVGLMREISGPFESMFAELRGSPGGVSPWRGSDCPGVIPSWQWFPRVW